VTWCAFGTPTRTGVLVRAPMHVLTFALVCSGCDYYTQLSSQAGEHVVYHWDADAWAAEGMQLCGGTVEAADGFVEGIASHYGWALGERGPTVEYFWDRTLRASVCRGKDACAVDDLGWMVFTYHPFDTHELAHATQPGSLQSFIAEGFAVRWQSGMIDTAPVYQTTPDFLSVDELRSQLDGSAEVDYGSAYTWWVALETTHGSAKMAEFLMEIGPRAGSSDVERALQRVFGISLSESAELAENLPALLMEDPVCLLDGLPTLAWDDSEPLVIDRGDAHCDDDDLISIDGRRAGWLVALEFPEPPVYLDVRVTVEQGDLSQKMLTMAKCDIGVIYDYTSYDSLSARDPDEPGAERHLAGRYVANLVGVVATDGSVDFPRVAMEELPSQP
jgi:hypothetical protein